MKSQVAQMLGNSQLSLSRQQISDHNEFLDLSSRFYSLQRNQFKNYTASIQQNKSVCLGSQPKLGRDKSAVYVNPNRSVKQILRDNLIRQKLRQQKLARRQKEIQDQIMLEKKNREVLAAEKKMKKRLAIQERRVIKLNKSESLQFAKQKNKSELICPSNPENQISTLKTQMIDQESQTIYNDRTIFKGPLSYVTNTIKSIKSLLRPIKQITRNKLEQKEPQQSFSSVLKFGARKHPRKLKIPTQGSLETNLFKKDEERSQIARRKQKMIQEQLQSLYAKQSKDSLGKAVQLTQKIQNNYRLRLKNMNMQDYKQARQKLKLLSFFYNIDN